MENATLQILTQGGAVGIAIALLFLFYDFPINGKATGLTTIGQFGLPFFISDIFIRVDSVTGLVLTPPVVSFGTNGNADNIASAVLFLGSVLVPGAIIRITDLLNFANGYVLAETNILCKVATAALGGFGYIFTVFVAGFYTV